MKISIKNPQPATLAKPQSGQQNMGTTKVVIRTGMKAGTPPG